MVESNPNRTFRSTRASRVRGTVIGLLFAAVMWPGCAALHPVRGVPAAYLPDQFHGPSRSNKRTIDLSLLVRSPSDQHRVAAGDVLSIYIPRVLGSQPTEVNTVGIEPPINMPHTYEDPPTLGYPITVRDDHTLALPQIPPINVYNMTLHQVEERIRRAYTVDHQILQPHEALVLVSLQRPRMHRILVVRQETSNGLSTGSGPGTVNIGVSKKGTARTVTLKAYENDVLHALALAEGVDGLPGLDAENTIYIIRKRQPGMGQMPGSLSPAMPGGPAHMGPLPPAPPIGNPNPGLPVPPLPMGTRTQTSPSAIQQASHAEPAGGPFGNYRQGAMSVAQATPSPSSPGGVSAMGTAPPLPYAVPTQPPLPSTDSPPRPWSASEHSGWSATPPMPVTDQMPPMATPDPRTDLSWPAMLSNFEPTIDNPNVVKIPVRLGPGEYPRFSEQDITLYDGDIVFIESRETEVFYTGGLLGGGQYTLPRDYDLRVLEAVSIAEGRSTGSGGGNGGLRSIGGVSALNQDVALSASRLAILRTLPNGQRITIEVDLKKALRYKEENIVVQPGDMLLLEYTLPEAVAAYTQRFLLEGALIGIATSMFMGGGSGGGG